MNYGLYLAAAGTLNHMQRQNILTNNLTNIDTVGFKPDTVAVQQRLPERLLSGSAVDPQYMLEQLSGVPHISPSRVSLQQGSLNETNKSLDLAIFGEGFFVVRDGQDIRMTRDGRFAMDAGGDLVTASEGFKVLDERNQPIRLDRGAPVEISERGEIIQNGKVRATLRVAEPGDPRFLEKFGHNLLSRPGLADAPQATARVRQGYLEGSPVDPIRTLNDIIDASKAAGATLTMMRYHGLVMDQAINTMGRVA